MRTEKSASSSSSTDNNWEEIDEHLDFIESFQDFRREERVALTKFIQAYESLPCLWDRKDPTFNSKTIKAHAYKQLAAVSKQLNPNAGNVEWVKNKITGLRAVFFRDYKKVVDSLKAGKGIFIPKLWYFGLMLFVTETEDCNVILNEKIRSLLNLKPTVTFDSDMEITGLITEKEKSEYRAAITEFIGIYKSHPILWNSMYRSQFIDKDLKTQAHQELLKSARSHFPGVDLDWVKMKIYKLRAVFWREHRKRERAMAAGEKVTSSLWYYDQLHFITEADNKVKPRTVQNDLPESSAEDPLEDLCEVGGAEEQLKYNYADEDCLDGFDLAQVALDSSDPGWNLVDSASDINSTKINMNELLLSTDSSQSVEQIPTSSSPIVTSVVTKPPRKKRKKTEEEPVMIHLPELPSTNYGAIDELNAFSASTAAKLRRMTQEQRDLAELEIGRILFLGLRGRLVDNTILPPVEQNYPDCTL